MVKHAIPKKLSDAYDNIVIDNQSFALKKLIAGQGCPYAVSLSDALVNFILSLNLKLSMCEKILRIILFAANYDCSNFKLNAGDGTYRCAIYEPGQKPSRWELILEPYNNTLILRLIPKWR